MELRKDLIGTFGYLAKVTSYHFLTEIGMPVLNPNTIIRRVFHRSGLIEGEGTSEALLTKAVGQGNEFAKATSHPIRYIDIVFVALGRGHIRSGDIGVEQGICLEHDPQCSICGVSRYCHYFTQKG